MNEELQHSEQLASHFTPYRDEAPLVSTQDIEKLLANHSSLPNRSHKTVRRLLMTLTGIAGLAVIGYLSLFNGTNGAHRAHPILQVAERTSEQHDQSAIALLDTTPKKQKQNVSSPIKPKEVGRWVAPGNIQYVELSEDQLLRLGIQLLGGDTIKYYDVLNVPVRPLDSKAGEGERTTELRIVHGEDEKPLPNEEHYQQMMMTGNLKSLRNIEKSVIPPGLRAPQFFPVLITSGDGQSGSYRYHDGDESGFGSMGKEDEIERWREWLSKPAVPGYHTIGFWTTAVSTTTCEGCQPIEFDTITIRVGKDVPARPFPNGGPRLNSFTPEHEKAFGQLEHYYEGTAMPPSIEWPKNVTIKADTVTADDILKEKENEENSSVLRHARAIFRRIGELVPVIVRKNGEKGKPGRADNIFWYEPSEELFRALPAVQARPFRQAPVEPHCMNAPAAVISSAEVTYCVSEAQEVIVSVIDLTGHVAMSTTQHAESGDNIAKISTASLPSGMYLVVVQDKEGSQRTRRIWVQNAHPH